MTALNQPLRQPDFQTTTVAKCILSGEHAVLRGHPALVVPLTHYSMTCQYWQTSAYLSMTVDGPSVIPERLPLADFIKYIYHQIPDQSAFNTGHFHLKFTMPIASGLGASASIAVAFARWCHWRALINESDLFKYAHRFEHFFHGNSSGVDVAAVLYEQPLVYQISQSPKLFKTTWSPLIYLSSTGQLSDTKKAVIKVLTSNNHSADQGRMIDLQMAESVKLMQLGLTSSPQSGMLLQQAFELGFDCYQGWGLNDHPKVQQHFADLKRYGAIAVKQTGAGDGGYVLSLWNQPPNNCPWPLMAVF